MNSEELDEVFDQREYIANRVTELVNTLLDEAKLTSEQEELVRMQLTEEYRFWRPL